MTLLLSRSDGQLTTATMSSLFAILSQRTPNLQTRKGLIIVDLQNDFISPEGKLPVKDTAFLDRIASLVPGFREHGDIIWVRSEFEATRPVNGDDTPGDTVVAGGSLGTDAELPRKNSKKRKHRLPASSATYKASNDTCKHVCNVANNGLKSSASFSKPDRGDNDEELFLTRTSEKEPCCVRGRPGAEYADKVKPLIDQSKDLQITKTHYSAFGSTSLLLTLRSRLVTDVYICGCITNLSVYATAMDAARYGINITLVDDCLGYRRKDRHEMAKRQLSDLMAAETMTASEVMRSLNCPEEVVNDSEDGGSASEEEPSGRKPDNQSMQTQIPGKSSSDSLEVDSNEDSDGEVSTSVGTSGRTLATRPRVISGTHSHEAAQRQPACPSRLAQPASSRFNKSATQSKKSASTTSHSGLKVDESSERRRSQPWLDMISSDRSSLSDNNSPPRTSQHPGLKALAALSGIPASTTEQYETLRLQALQDRLSQLELEAQRKQQRR